MTAGLKMHKGDSTLLVDHEAVRFTLQFLSGLLSSCGTCRFAEPNR